MKYAIQNIAAHEILDSRGSPTLEVGVTLESGMTASASVPSGASTGSTEAHELRDQEPDRYNGKGVLKAVSNVRELISPALQGHDVQDQKNIDETLIALDGTVEKKRLGGNAMLGVSLACARAAASAQNMSLYSHLQHLYAHAGGDAALLQSLFALPGTLVSSKKADKLNLPFPMMNIFNGGKHADTNLDFQEFIIIPTATPRAYSQERSLYPFHERVRVGVEIFHRLAQVLQEHGLDTDVGNEGGYAPDIDSSVAALDMIIEAIERAGYVPGKDVYLGMDVGAAVLYRKDKNDYAFKLDHSFLGRDELISLYEDWLKRYPFLSIEDGLDENDWEGWSEMTKRLGERVQLVGDDLFTTNKKRLQQGIAAKAANSILIKPNQIGTLTETLETVVEARKAGYRVVVSHRSGETCDTFIADLAVAVQADFIKTGAPSRGERVAKYNRLMAIEEELRKQNAK